MVGMNLVGALAPLASAGMRVRGTFALAAHPHNGATSDPTLWYLTRATAVAAYIALTASVYLGILRSIARTAGERLSWVADELHAVIATLAGLLVVGHLVSIKLDSFVSFSFANLLLPGNQPYQPVLGVNLGVFALYTMALLLLSSWLRRRIPYGLWRAIHYLSFVAFVLVTAHGLMIGSDAGEVWMRALYTGASCGLGFLLLMRLVTRKRPAVVAASV
jgi:predicted ferric reductase